jgi:hypothetical protein
MALTFDTSNILKNVAVATEYFKAYYAIQYQNEIDNNGKITQKFSGGTNGFIPFNIDFTVDGISGIKIYNKILVNTSFLPNGYTRTTDFIVTGVDHKLIDHDWVTNIKTTLIPKFQDSDKVITAQNFESIKFQIQKAPIKIPTIETVTDLSTKPNNLDGSPCTEVNGKRMHTGYEPQFRKRTVKSITLHYAVNNSTAEYTVYYVGRCEGIFIRGGIHYAIDRSGTVAAGIPETIFSVHGDLWNENGIGIELASFGSVSKKIKTGEWIENAYGKTIPNNEVVDLGFKYEGHQYYQDYDDITIASLENLIRNILGRYPDIKKGIDGVNLWRYVFGLENGKPKPGDDVYSQDASEYGGYGQYGLFSHSTGGGDHTDTFPSPKMVEMLKRLGYVENAIDSSSTTPNNIIIGDSQTKNVKKYSKNVTLIDALTKGSQGVGWLRDQVAAYPVSSNVKNVVLCIGVNGGYSSNGTAEKGLFTALHKTFPNAKIYAVQGSWGWGGVSDYTENQVRTYYKNYYKDKGAILIDPPIGYGDPHTDKPVYKLIGAAIDSIIK